MIYTTLAFAMLSLAAGAPGACEQHKDCHSCIEVDPTNNCGYCRDPVTASTPASGNRCVDINEKYNCPSDFWTDKCEAGFTCNMTSLQCVQSTVRPDYKTMADCQKSCVAQPPPPPTPSPAPVSPTPIGPPPPPTPARYQCQVVHNAPQCSTCQPGGNATTCLPCERGSFCPEGSPVPQRCPAGTFSAATDLSAEYECTRVGPGFWSSMGAAEAELCPVDADGKPQLGHRELRGGVHGRARLVHD